MKNRRRTKRRVRAIRIWSYPDANKVLPYVRSLTSSLREHWLDLQSRQLDAKRLHQVAKPTKAERIALEEIKADADRAETKFDLALEDLMRLDVFLLDPVQGVALIPFQREDELAWYVFDLFHGEGLDSWRFHRDPLEMRRPVKDPPAEPLPAPAGHSIV